MTQRFLVLGLGKSGLSTIQFLKDKQIPVVGYDDFIDKAKTDALGIDLFQDIEKIPFHDLTAIIQSPGIPFLYPKPHPVTERARNLGLQVLSDVDLFQRYRPQHIPCIGITGTNGKTTTTTLITHLLNYDLEKNHHTKKAYMGGNVGIGILDLLKADVISNAAYYVLELSSYQLEIIQHLILDVGIFLNLTPDHLDRHGTLENYRKAKEKILQFSRYQLRGEQLRMRMTLDEMEAMSCLRGEHNLQNVNAAFLALNHLHISNHSLYDGLKSFKGVEHRMEVVFKTDILSIVNDSKATNPDATSKALKSLAREDNTDIYWIAGGRAKPGGFSILDDVITRVKMAYFIGECEQDLKNYFDQISTTPSISKLCHSLNNAVHLCFKDLEQQSSQSNKIIILFSPACASFDQFKNFEHRGEAFKSIIHDFVKRYKTND